MSCIYYTVLRGTTYFFFQAEDGIRDGHVTGVQTCALPILCGSGVKENLLPVIQKKNLEKKIKVFENRDDIPRFLQTLDCYFFPSITEGQPNALIEAMIIGIPYISSNILLIK